jgi:hypothetical protein
MCLAALKQAIPGLADKSHYDKIKIFGWWLHVHKRKPSDPGRPNRAIETQRNAIRHTPIRPSIKVTALCRNFLSS